MTIPAQRELKLADMSVVVYPQLISPTQFFTIRQIEGQYKYKNTLFGCCYFMHKILLNNIKQLRTYLYSNTFHVVDVIIRPH